MTLAIPALCTVVALLACTAPHAIAGVTFRGCVRDDTSSAPCSAIAPAIDAALPIALSPAGDQVYTGSLGEDTVTAFGRDATSGALTNIGCWQTANPLRPDICGGRRATGLTYPTAVAASPDGRNLYAVGSIGNSVVTFARNPITGDLSFVNCWTDPTSPQGEHPDCRGNNTAGLSRPTGIAVSPDGANVYVTAAFSSTLAVFNRDPATGVLTPAGCFRARSAAATCARVSPGLGLVAGVVVTPDGNSVYVTSYQGAVAVFERSSAAGHPLTARGCVGLAALGCRPQRSPSSLERASFPRVSADNRTLVVAGRGVTVFARDPATGGLTWAGCLDAPGSVSCGPVSGLSGAIGVALSPDGQNVYVNSGGIVGQPGAMVVLARNTRTGILTFVACIKNPASRLPCSRSAPALDGQGDVAVSPRGDFVYTVAGDPGASAIVWFARTPDRPRPATPGVTGSVLPVSSPAVAVLPIACLPGVTEFCNAAIDLSLPTGRRNGRAAARTLQVGAARFRTQTRRGRTTVRVRLSRVGRRAFKQGRLRVRVRLIRTNPNGTRTTTSRTITLRVRR